MKRIICLMMIIVVLCSMVGPVSATTADNMIQPRWSYLNSVTAYLDINWLGVASCTGSAIARNDVEVKVVVNLQQLTDTGWATVNSWSSTGNITASASGRYAVYRGYTYRVTVTGYVYDSNGKIIETGSAIDTFVF